MDRKVLIKFIYFVWRGYILLTFDVWLSGGCGAALRLIIMMMTIEVEVFGQEGRVPMLALLLKLLLLLLLFLVLLSSSCCLGRLIGRDASLDKGALFLCLAHPVDNIGQAQ